ncbi:MAG: 3-oxoadipate enol-lactonase [Myxococcota bacterium]
MTGRARLTCSTDGAETAPPLVLLHSLGLDSSMWTAQAEAWARTHRVICVDLPGHGRSQDVACPETLAGLADIVLETIDHTLAGRFDLCGLSLGGQIALYLAAHAPKRVRRLVACATAAKIGTAESWNERAAAVRTGGLEKIADMALERFFSPSFRTQAPDTYAGARATLLAVDSGAYLACCAAIRDADLRPVVPSIAAPTLVLAGEVDVSTPPAVMGELARRLPDAEFEVLPGVGHIFALESAREVSSRVGRFLSRA